MKIQNDSYRSCAQGIANKIESAWNSYLEPDLNFWRIANAFTTLIDFFRIDGKPNLVIGKSVYDAFQSKNSTGWWYDDYSWWIVAFLRANQYQKFVGVYQKTWPELVQVCWDEMAPATQVWANADQSKFALAKPRFGYGCWNHNFLLSDGDDNCDPLNRKPNNRPWPACGIQNTVTNTQFLVCAARFKNVATGYRFLWSWFYDATLSEDNRLLANYPNVGQLVRERVSTFAETPDKKYPAAPNYDKDRHWTGDQGILLGALLELMRIDPNNQKIYRDMATSILGAVKTKLTKLVNNRQILQPWTPPNTIGSIYLTDYATGVGVFMRHLLYGYDSGDPVLKPYIASADYKGFIKDNADAVCASVGNCTLPDGSEMDDMECLLNQLAVLNAAIVILAQ
jgi:hypothetical protein